MAHILKIAAIQMIAAPAPTPERLARAQALIARAASEGAQLAVLPEVFNTGYAYSDANYARAEPLDGPTIMWLKQTAAQHNIYVAGTLLLRDGGEIYNALFLVAPEGELWRYDKRYPWTWERAYFRPGAGSVVAKTPLGNFGLLICFDQAHSRLWAQYAGRVDAMLVCSCPPTVHKLRFELADGTCFTAEDSGPIHRQIQRTGDGTFGALLRRQAAQLGVPVVNTTGAGDFVTELPLPRASALVYALFRPDLWARIVRTARVQVRTGYFHETYVADAAGQVLAQVPAEEEGYVVAEVALAAAPPQPAGPQPAFGLSPFVYLYDWLANFLLARVYRREVRRRYGVQGASPRCAWRWGRAALAAVLGLLLAWSLHRAKRRR